MIAISIDGDVVPASQAAIPVLDRGFLYGDGIFEVLRTWNGIAVDLNAHLDRLLGSAVALRFHAIDRASLSRSVKQTVEVAQVMDRSAEHRVRIIVTRGSGGLAERLAEVRGGHSIVIVEPLAPQPAELAAAIVDWPLPRRKNVGYKTLAYLDHVLARELAAEVGADEALRLDDAGFVVEGSTSNLFVAQSGCVITPPTDGGVLPGVTRGHVLQCCARLEIPAVVERVRVDQLRTADEIFITSSLRGVVPITRLDGHERIAGPLTARLARAYLDLMQR